MIFEITPNTSINEALKKLNKGDTLLLNDGIYNEKIEIWNEDIILQAKHPLKAILSNKDYYHKIMADHNECNTFRTYTLYVGGNHIKLDGLVIKNEATPSYIYGQAVALHVDGDSFLCENCQILSAQDTLFTGPLPKDLLTRYKSFYPENKLKGNPSKQIYRNCDIAGDVDFIFGCATALFENCKIISVSRNSSIPSYVCAPAHAQDSPYGYLFYKCEFVGTEPAFLARPWRDYGCAAFVECILGSHIVPEGYNKWNETNRDKTARFYEYTPSIDTSKRVAWSHQMSTSEAKKYVEKFIDFLNQNSK